MRKEATSTQWRTLYELALQLKAMEPWRFFMNTDLLKVEWPDHEPVYVSILGHHGLNYAIALYVGEDNLSDYFNLSILEQSGISSRYLFYNQETLICNFGDRDDVPTEQYKVIKELGFRFRGKNQWVYFTSIKPYFEPFIPDQEEVELLIKVYEQLIPLIEAFINREIKVDYDDEEILVRTYHAERNAWENRVESFNFNGKQMEVIQVYPEEDLFQWLINQPSVNAELELDLNYLYSNIEELEEQFGRPVNPKFVLLADHIDGFILRHEIITNKEEESDIIIDVLFSFIERFGIPKCIHFRLPAIGFLLKELSSFLGIHLIQSQELPSCDEFYNEFLGV